MNSQTRRKITLLVLFLLIPLMITVAYGGNDGGSALDFDGTDDYVSIPDNSAYDFGTGPLTIETWTFRDSGVQQIFFDWSTNDDVDNVLALFRPGSGELRLTVKVDNVNSSPISGGPGVTTNEWHHVALTRDGAGNWNAYLNGEAYDSGNDGGKNLDNIDTGSPIWLGADDNGGLPVRALDGRMEEVRIWSTERTQTQIQDNMFKELTGSETGLVGYWQLNDGVGQTVTDSSSTGNDGTMGSTGLADANDPAWITSLAPIGDSTASSQTDLAALWSSVDPAESGGLTFSDNGTTPFLNDVSDDIVFGHNNQVTNTSADVPVTGDWAAAPDPARWVRIWYCDLNDANSNGGSVDLIFDYDDAGMGADTPALPASNYRLLERAGTSGIFTDIATATAVNAVDKTVTFTGVSTSSVCSYITLGTLDNSTSPTAITLQSGTAQSNNMTLITWLIGLSIVFAISTIALVRRKH